MTLQRRVLSSELHARRWMTRQVGPSAGTSSTPRGSVRTVRIRKGVGDRTVLWQAPSSGSRSTRILKIRERARGGRRRTVTAGARVHGRIGGHLRGARIGIVETETVAIADGRAEKDEATDEETIEVANVIDVRAVKETARGAEAVMETALPEVMEISGRRDQSEEISKDCREPQPWARPTTGKHQVQAAGTLLGVLRPVEPSKLLPETVMRSPKLKVAIRLQDAI